MSLFEKEETYTLAQIKEVIERWHKGSDVIYDNINKENQHWIPAVKLIVNLQYKTILAYFKLPYKDINNDDENK